jgi:glycerophosphoryl diester phosphodiesterase
MTPRKQLELSGYFPIKIHTRFFQELEAKGEIVVKKKLIYEKRIIYYQFTPRGLKNHKKYIPKILRLEAVFKVQNVDSDIMNKDLLEGIRNIYRKYLHENFIKKQGLKDKRKFHKKTVL